MENLGYVRMYRSLMKKGYYQNSEHVHLWLHLIFKATYAPKEFLFNETLERLQPGQFITSRRKLSVETGIHESKVERILNVFKIEHQIEQQSRNKFRIISILNWDEYQNSEQVNELQMNSQRTASEQQANTNNNIKNIKNTNKQNTKDLLFVLPEWIPRETWNAYLEVRKKKRAAPTSYALTLIIKKLLNFKREFGHDPIAVLNKSILSGWPDVYALKPENKGDNNGENNRLGGAESKPISTKYAQLTEDAERRFAGIFDEGDGKEPDKNASVD